MKEVLVVIPIYKSTFSASEWLALKQVSKVLHNHPICFVAPKNLQNVLDVNYRIVFFDDSFFLSTFTYSKLLLSPEFYLHFCEYKYMLIYQLDAFAFSDQLLYFCSLDYDYIGAPVPKILWPNIGARIGNGGFSLRKIESCIRVTKEYHSIIKQSKLDTDMQKSEDKFFGYCGKAKSVNFNVPSMEIAQKFALEFDVARCFQSLSANNLPFGCHRWPIPELFPVWRPYMGIPENALEQIEKEVAMKGFHLHHLLRASIHTYLSSRIIRNPLIQRSLFDNKLPCNRDYIIWGNGYIGKASVELLKKLKRNIICIFDTFCKQGESLEGIPVIFPNDNLISSKKTMIVIATTKYEKEIEKRLLKHGVTQDNFICYSTIRDIAIQEHYGKIWKRMCSS